MSSHPFDTGLPTCRAWKGNTLPHPDRHVAPNPTFLAPRHVGLGWIVACDLCGLAYRRDLSTPAASIERERVDHMGSAHHDLLVAGLATIHLTDTTKETTK